MFRGLFHGLNPRPHDHDHALGIGRAFIFKGMIITPGALAELAHGLVHDFGNSVVIPVHAFARLKINVGILRRAAQNRMVRRKRPAAVFADKIFIQHGQDNFFVDHFDF